MGRKRPLNLLVPAEFVVDVFQSKAQKEIAKNRLLGITIESVKMIFLREHGSDVVYGRSLPLLSEGVPFRCERSNELSFAPSLSET